MMGTSTMGMVTGSGGGMVDTIGAPPASVPAKVKTTAKIAKKGSKKNKKRAVAKKKATKAPGSKAKGAHMPKVAGKKKAGGKSNVKRSAKK